MAYFYEEFDLEFDGPDGFHETVDVEFEADIDEDRLIVNEKTIRAFHIKSEHESGEEIQLTDRQRTLIEEWAVQNSNRLTREYMESVMENTYEVAND
jgi:hypothetical protein